MAGFFSKVFGGKSEAEAEKPAHSATKHENPEFEEFGEIRIVDLDQVRAAEAAAAAFTVVTEASSSGSEPTGPIAPVATVATVSAAPSTSDLPSNHVTGESNSTPTTMSTSSLTTPSNNSGDEFPSFCLHAPEEDDDTTKPVPTTISTAAVAGASSSFPSASSPLASPSPLSLDPSTNIVINPLTSQPHQLTPLDEEETEDDATTTTTTTTPLPPSEHRVSSEPSSTTIVTVHVPVPASPAPITQISQGRPSPVAVDPLVASGSASTPAPSEPAPSEPAPSEPASASASISTQILILSSLSSSSQVTTPTTKTTVSPASPSRTPTTPTPSSPSTYSRARASTASSSGSLSASPPHISSFTTGHSSDLQTKSRSSTLSIALSDVSTFSSSARSTTSTALSDYTPSPSFSRSSSPCPPTPATFLPNNNSSSSSGITAFPTLTLSASASARSRAYSSASASSVSTTGRSRYNKQELHAARVQRAASKSVSFAGTPGPTAGPQSASARASGALRNRFKRSASSPVPPSDQNSPGNHSNPAEKPKEGLVRMAFAEQQRWITVQQKTFTKWLNTKIEVRDLQVNDLVKDLSDGVILIHLLECLSNESLGRYASKPKLRVQRFENANLALDFIKSRGIQMTNIGAEDVVDGNRKIILGLIWTLILRFTINDINEEGMTAKEGLLLWCQRKTACYDEVDVRDFSTSWNDGLAFCALLDIHRPDLIDYDSLDKSDHRGNMQLAFDIAHKEIGIPKLLDVEDVCDVAKPDERSLMTYIAYWFHAFSQMEKVENAGRRVEKFVLNMQGAWEMQSAYERRMAALLAALTSQQESWTTATFEGTYADAKAQAAQFAAYKRGLKREWVAEKSELATLLGNIKTKLGTYRLRPYEPPRHLSLENMEIEWGLMSKAEMTRAQLINETIRDIKNALRKSFADKANDFALALNAMQLAISGLEGDIEDQLVLAKQLNLKIPPLDAYLETIEAVDLQCQEANIEENDFTTYTLDELVYELGLVKSSVQKKLSFLENQMVARNMTNLTPIQLEEFESVFRHFDRTDSNALTELEFSAALASLGLVFSEDEMHDYFAETSHGRDRVTFEQFIRFMVEVTEDQNSAEQVFQSFREVADGKPYVTEMDLRHSLVPDEVIEKLTEIMPPHQGPDMQVDRGQPQFDYIAFMDKMMADVDDSVYDDEADLEGDSLESSRVTGEEGSQGNSFASSGQSIEQ